MRLAGPRPPEPERAPKAEVSVLAPIVAFLLALVGAVAFATGAMSDVWQVWAAGMVCVVAGLAVYRP